MIIPRQKIRLALDTTDPSGALDVQTGQAPRIYRGYDAQVELLFKYQGLIADITNITSVNFNIKAAARTGDPLVSKTIASFDATITEDSHATWDAGTSQHALILLNSADSETSMTVTGTETEYFFNVEAVTSAGLTYCVGFGAILVEETGKGGLTAPTPAPPVSYTKAESDARYLGGAIQQVNSAGVTITLTHATNGKQIILGVGDDGELSINTISP